MGSLNLPLSGLSPESFQRLCEVWRQRFCLDPPSVLLPTGEPLSSACLNVEWVPAGQGLTRVSIDLEPSQAGEEWCWLGGGSKGVFLRPASAAFTNVTARNR
jgi:hypothetical protein